MLRLAHTVLMPGFAGASAPLWVLQAVRGGLGGVCYFGHNIESSERVTRLSAELHAAGGVLISVDEEGGIVTRLHAKDGSPHVGAAVLGRGDGPGLTRVVAGLIGTEVRIAGIDIDLAPVADVNSNPANPVIGVRSFGADPARVAEHTRAFVVGLQSSGVAACAKHFPGHGDTAVDSHVGLPTVGVSLETLRARELVPFVAAIDAGVRCVMTAHAVFTAIDDKPATISPAALDLLRGELGFDGVIISDAIDMQAISGTVGFAEGVVRALIAGVDLVALGNPVLGKQALGDGEDEFSTALSAVLEAVAEGRLTVERLAQSAERIHALRDWVVSHDEVAGETDSTADDDAARIALRLRGQVGLRGPVHCVDVRRRRNIASGGLTSLLTDELVARMPGSTTESVFEAGVAVEGKATGGDDVGADPHRPTTSPDVILTGTPGQDQVEDGVVEALLAAYPDAVVVCLGWSGDDSDIAMARNAIFAFGDSRPTARAVVDAMCR